MAASSSPYQSRFFNFIHQQSQRVSDNLAIAWRHLRVAANWSAQIILYPLYLILHPNQLTDRALRSSTPQTPTLPPTTDQPIQRILDLIHTQPSSFLASQAAGQRACPTIQGIATQLSTRKLVLTTSENQILDILTPQHQQAIEAHILTEVANYWRYHRIAHSAKSITPTLALLDETIAKLESNQLAKLPEIALALKQRIGVIGIPTWRTKTQTGITSSSFEFDQLKISALIRAAINYFFGDRFATKLRQTLPTTRKALTQRFNLPTALAQPLDNSSVEDPWLSHEDLFGTPKAAKTTSYTTTSLTAETTNQLAGNPNPTFSHQQVGRKSLWQKLSQSKLTFRLTQQQESKSQVPTVSSGSNKLEETAPDWVEAQATTAGYVKHPLERLLEWLDLGMLWLEEQLVKIKRWLLQGKL